MRITNKYKANLTNKISETLYKKGIEVFGTEDKFYTWMESKIIALGNARPKILLVHLPV